MEGKNFIFIILIMKVSPSKTGNDTVSGFTVVHRNSALVS